MKSSSQSASSRPQAPATRRRREHLALRYFLRGLVVLVPVTLTIAIVYWLFRKVDGLFKPYVETTGLGALLVFSLIFGVGWISLFPASKRIFGRVNVWLEQTPGVSFIYTSARDFLEAFAGNKRRFTHAVLVNVHSEEVWLVGFLTDEDLSGFKLGVKYVAVYVPQAYNVAGQLYLVKRENVRPIEHLEPADVMKYAVTGGAVELVTGATSAKAKAEEKSEAEAGAEAEPTVQPAAT
jgi:uncharacterized membrane protein